MRGAEGDKLPFDYVLIETTGLADPSPIVQILCRQEMDRSCFYLDAVVAVVDVKHVLLHLRPSGRFGFARRRAEAAKQIAFADRVILNKLDLFESNLESEQACEDVCAEVRAINASAKLIRARHADVHLAELLE